MTDSALLEAVTFDCWGTLIYESDPHAGDALRLDLLFDLARRARPVLTREEAEEALRAAHHHHVELWRNGIGSGPLDISRWALAALGLAEAQLEEPLAAALAEASLAQEVVPLAGAVETLRALASDGVRLALVCDTGFSPGRVVRRLLERGGLLEHLEVQIFSDEVGVPKPHPRTFQAALGGLSIAPERALHVGDLRRTDVAGGRDVGMRTVRIRDVHDDASELPDADHVVASHEELRALLRSLME